jgi:hypothetical protein
MGKITRKYIGQNQVGSAELLLENNAALRGLDNLGAAQNLFVFDDLNKLHSNLALNIPLAQEATHAVRKDQVDTEIAAINQTLGQITSNFVFKYGVKAATADADLRAVAADTELSTLLPFSDDEGTPLVLADFAAGDYILSEDGANSKLFKVIDLAGVLYVSTVDVPALVDGDGFLVEYDLLASPASEETTSLYSFFGGLNRIGTVNWNFAKGIKFSAEYGLSESFGILAGDNIEAVVRKIETVYAAKILELEQDIADEAAARLAADGLLQTAINDEVTAREALAQRVTDVEGEVDALTTDVEAAQQDIVDLEAAVLALQNATVAFEVESHTLTALDIANGYFDTTYNYIPKSLKLGVGERVNLYQGLDYTAATVGGVTRITFAGPSAAGQPEALEEGQVIYLGGAVNA